MLKEVNQEQDMYLSWPMQFFLETPSCSIL
jgi:hypothetical protein